MRELLRDALKLVVPEKDEVEAGEKAEKELRKRLKDVGVEFTFVGSYARKTWLKGNLEIDVFILIPTNVGREELEKLGIEVGKKVLDRYEVRYAEHPYVHGEVLGVKVDLVPCYKVESAEKILSAVDRTPFHHEWLKDKVAGKENDVRLLKKFLKANGIYGAEFKVKGFSGYLCELLIIFYGSFENLIKNASRWTRRTVIDVSKGEVRSGENFFVVDPVDPKRNVAANLSLENLAKFVHLCREFIKNPKIDFFIEKDFEVSEEKILEAMRIRNSSIFALEFERPEIFEDNLYSQLERAAKKIYEHLEREGFKPIRYHYFAEDKCYLVFECEVRELSKVYRKVGPPFEEYEHVDKFLKKDRIFKPFIDGGRWWSFEIRKFTKPQEFVEDFVTKNFSALGKNVGEFIAMKGFRIIEGPELLKIKKELAKMIGVVG
ncbi:MAG: CCA tRNA nucleotidyltransferase [Archaeoglobaceae archaeon]|nr:CCA tRNA nucleotidyltransferase [Archaeoglobaceae archaeon]MCX8152337.1 CCA tRNA nucleotidyltransferase [Archaeoglobaceae archaeon]MDW8013635.1 CCA tRNA nucleotidyltransferase [Archaeoglobaceae archaeon]